jgi:hypothetical protein
MNPSDPSNPSSSSLPQPPEPSGETQPFPDLLGRARALLQERGIAESWITRCQSWITHFLYFFRLRHPRHLGTADVEQFLQHLAAQPKVPADEWAVARRALLFFYRDVLGQPLDEPFLDQQVVPRARQPAAESSAAPAPSASPVADVPAPPPRLLDQVRQVLRVRHYSFNTEECYVRWIKHFILFHHKRHPREMGAREVESFLGHLAVEEHVSASTQNQALSALLFLYHQVLEVQLGRVDAIRARRPERLPVVMSREEVCQVLDGIRGAEGLFQLMCKLQYGSGLRVMESCRVRVHDVDPQRGQITVRDGKGAKDRIVMLPRSLREPLAAQLERRREQHRRDLDQGVAWVWLPDALARKYPNAPRVG